MCMWWLLLVTVKCPAEKGIVDNLRYFKYVIAKGISYVCTAYFIV